MGVQGSSKLYDNKQAGHKGAANASREKLLTMCLAG